MTKVVGSCLDMKFVQDLSGWMEKVEDLTKEFCGLVTSCT
jgi:hypothetical protein